MDLMFLVPFLVGWLAVAGWLLYLTATRKTYRLDRESLNVTTELVFWSSSMLIPRDSIFAIRQVKDHGDDSFPTWGLRIESSEIREETPLMRFIPVWLYRVMTVRLWPEFPNRPGNQTHALLYRQPYEQSRWLGITIATWAGVTAAR